MGEVKNAGFTGSMYWTLTSSNSPLNFDDLHLDLRAVPGHIHLHNDNSSRSTQTFLLEEQPDPADRRSWKWRDITAVYTPELIIQPPFVIHPIHSTNALKLLTSGTAWVPKYVLLTGIKEKWRQANKTEPPRQRSSRRLAAGQT